MIDQEYISGLRVRLQSLRSSAAVYFRDCHEKQLEDVVYTNIWDDLLTEALRARGEELRVDVKRISVDIAGPARGSPLIADADLQDLRHNTRRMLSSLRFNRYQYWGLHVHHDEGVVLGVDPPSQGEKPVSDVGKAQRAFEEAAAGISDLVDLLLPAAPNVCSKGSASYRPNTAFIMMAIDSKQPELQDVRQGIKDVCEEFGITAITADEIEHDGAITDRILEEIETSEFLIADLTGERPNVYYELGHAHAREKRVMVYRRADTKLHFDIAHRNCPSYDNVTNLKLQLRKRLESATNKPKKH
jgi:hypothetical protein